MKPEERREQARQGAQQREQQERKDEQKQTHARSGKEWDDKARSREGKTVERLESGKGNPVEKVLYERQKAILENQRAIMIELGIDADS